MQDGFVGGVVGVGDDASADATAAGHPSSRAGGDRTVCDQSRRSIRGIRGGDATAGVEAAALRSQQSD